MTDHDEEPAMSPVTPPRRVDVRADHHWVADVSGDFDVSIAPRFAGDLDQLAAPRPQAPGDAALIEFRGEDLCI